MAIRFNEGKLLITKTGCQTFCWLFLEEIDCTTCLAPIPIHLKLFFILIGFFFYKFENKNELLKIVYLIASNKHYYYKTRHMIIPMRHLICRYKV